MSALEVHAQGFWAPGFATLGAWLLGEPDPSVIKPAASIIPAITRRRTSLLTRAMAEVMGQLLGGSDVDGASLPTVFASAHGETSTLGFLLDQLHGPEPGLSPIRFSGSVHNAASGYTSIALGNRRFTTSIAAGQATVAAALLEAQAFLSRAGGCVAIVVGDTAPLPELTRAHERFETFAAGWLLSREDREAGFKGLRAEAWLAPLWTGLIRFVTPALVLFVIVAKMGLLEPEAAAGAEEAEAVVELPEAQWDGAADRGEEQFSKAEVMLSELSANPGLLEPVLAILSEAAATVSQLPEAQRPDWLQVMPEITAKARAIAAAALKEADVPLPAAEKPPAEDLSAESR